MYLPSMFFGGSSLIHLLASNPRVVAVFGVGALVTTLLQTPFGTADVMGTAAYVEQLDKAVRQQGAVDPDVIENARQAAVTLSQAPARRLSEIVESTLLDCGAGCLTIETSAVLKNPTVLHEVLFLHTLIEVNHQRTLARAAAAGSNTSTRPGNGASRR